MEKTKSKLVRLSGCDGCIKVCKYNGEIADPAVASSFNDEVYGCNSGLVGFNLDEGIRKGESYVG